MRENARIACGRSHGPAEEQSREQENQQGNPEQQRRERPARADADQHEGDQERNDEQDRRLDGFAGEPARGDG